MSLEDAVANLLSEARKMRQEISRLEEELSWFRATKEDDDVLSYQKALGLRATPARILVLLMRQSIVSQDAIFQELYNDRHEEDWPSPEVIGQHIYRLRRALENKCLSAKVRCERKLGRQISRAGKEEIQQHVNEWDEREGA